MRERVCGYELSELQERHHAGGRHTNAWTEESSKADMIMFYVYTISVVR